MNFGVFLQCDKKTAKITFPVISLLFAIIYSHFLVCKILIL